MLPFLGILTSPETVFNSSYIKPIVILLGIEKPQDLLIPLTIGFAIVTLLATIFRLLTLWFNTVLASAIGSDLSKNIYRRTLYQPYSVHCSRNSSEIISGILTKTNAIINLIKTFVTIISSSALVSTTLIAFIYYDPEVAILSFVGFGLSYFLVVVTTKKSLVRNSYFISSETGKLLKTLQEGLGGIRDVLLDRSQETYVGIFGKIDWKLRISTANNAFIGSSPRILIEALGMMFMIVLTYIISLRPEGLATAIPTLGVLALGAQRILPILQNVYNGWASFSGSEASLKDAIGLLNQPMPEYLNQTGSSNIKFSKEIFFKDIEFKYSDSTPYVLKGVNLIIKKGSRVGFIGVTGSGKSTTLDILMGLLTPSRGHLLIDGIEINKANIQDWQSHISHVPQSIFLADATIAENIAFGIEKDKVNIDKVIDAAKKAQLSETIEAMTNRYDTMVGERGVRLSGGQRQRIGIARALYKNSEVIILDEATSSLDSDTEQEVMNAINSLDRDITIVIVAHRISTLKNCDQIIELESGVLKRICTYDEIVKT
ncbi:ABC transporter ATP-binding protein [Leptospira sp. GIMC2001]|uniref:ABC transporter ATP-binding protein n=1 Tax=Leptospira sp. GIMC2001 TaxID=1513297 RepID=UPI00300DE69B